MNSTNVRFINHQFINYQSVNNSETNLVVWLFCGRGIKTECLFNKFELWANKIWTYFFSIQSLFLSVLWIDISTGSSCQKLGIILEVIKTVNNKKFSPRLIHILWKLILKNDIIGIFDWSFFSVIMHQNVCGPIICNALFWIVKFFDFIILFKKSNLFLQHLWQKAEVGWKNCERRVGSFIKREPLLFLHNYLWENLNLILHVECEEGGYISPLVVNYLSALRYDNGVK